MFDANQANRLMLLVAASVAAVALAACGSSATTSSGASAQTLLRQTFGAGHKVDSGVLDLDLALNPSGSSALSGPVTLSLSGPFQSRGSGRLPASDFTIAVSALGRHGSLGVISTGTSGYVTLEGTGYQLPAADFTRVESGFSGVESSNKSQSGLSGLGIDPVHWLTDPTVVGTESVGGVATTHIHAGVNVAGLLADLSTLLQKTTASTASSSTHLPSSISAASRQKIAASVKNASVDVWTGQSDKTLRKLRLNLTIPVTGKISELFGGLSSAGIQLTLQYSGLNQPQTISAPADIKPYSAFTAKLGSLTSALKGSIGGLSGLSGSGASGGSGTSPAGSPSAASMQKFTNCVEKAAGNTAAMKKCQPLLSGG
jgi:hypothetical protein